MSKELLTPNTALSIHNTESIILYSSAPSPCARRVRITLIEKAISFDTVEISLPNMEQRTKEYLALNPNGYVPTMSHGERVVFESSVINQYLEEQFPDVALMPKDSAGRAKVAMWIEAEAHMAKIFRPIMYQRIQAPVIHISRTLDESLTIVARATHDPIDQAWQKKVWNLQVLNNSEEAKHQRQLLHWLDLVESALMGQEFLVGNQFSQADISLFPRIEMYAYLDIKMNAQRYPNVLRWMARLKLRPSFEASMTDDAKKLRKLATSKILPKVRNILKKPKKNLKDKIFIWAIGRIMRKMQKVELLLSNKYISRALPLPKKSLHAVHSLPVESFSGEMKKESLTLYANVRSVHSQRIVTLLNALNVNYKYQEIDLNSQPQTQELLTLNPLGQVPALKHGALVLYDSGVIAQYLCQQFDKQQHWFPKNSWHNAKHKMWLALEAGTHKEFKPLWDQYILNKPQCQGHNFNEQQSFSRIYDQLNQLENALSISPFLCGDSIQYADLAWHSRITKLNTITRFTLKAFPSISNWLIKTTHTIAKSEHKKRERSEANTQ
jgi:GST-like protein